MTEPNATMQPMTDGCTPPTVPNRNCYQIGEDRIWACEYPGALTDSAAIAKVQRALDFGITHFIDLTEEGELNPYAQFLPSHVSYTRFPIRDVSIPTSLADTLGLMLQMREILKDPRNRIYLHCWGGVGRTGTMAACWIAFSRQTDFATTMRTLLEYWHQCPKSRYRAVPDHSSQLQFIADFIDFRDRQFHFSAGAHGACAYHRDIDSEHMLRCWQHAEYQCVCTDCGGMAYVCGWAGNCASGGYWQVKVWCPKCNSYHDYHLNDSKPIDTHWTGMRAIIESEEQKLGIG